MDNTLSDVNFVDDSNALGTLVIAGAALGGILVTCAINYFRNKGIKEEVKQLRKTVGSLNDGTEAKEMADSIIELRKKLDGFMAAAQTQNPQVNAATVPA